ncbi:MAG: hypothetical protein QNJ12_20595 [Ilumatobacter sp.]|uniref:hypothetical protein n=1 Tax=Ilumatobacter sp. TaxID=1967498 RepID=UPI00262A587B|nr:hypothetical protein [Ilumatobacter sp.]MDJ0771199.1 hypothetical protein [Ilumatobacter sp.]
MRQRDPNHRRRGTIGVLAALALVGVAGCGGDDDDAGSDPADAEASGSDAGGDGGDDSTDAGGDSSGGAGDSDDAGGAVDSSGSADTGGGDFPIPAPDGLILDALVDAGIPMDSQRQLYYPNDDFDRLVAFYDDWISQNGEWARTEVEGSVIYQSFDDDRIRQISITPDEDPGAQAEGPAIFVLLVAG